MKKIVLLLLFLIIISVAAISLSNETQTKNEPKGTGYNVDYYSFLESGRMVQPQNIYETQELEIVEVSD